MNPRMTIWLALLTSTFIYLIIAVTVAGESGTFEESAKSIYVPVLYGMALLSFIFAWFAAPRVIKGPPQTKMIVTLAFFESCAIYGLLAAFLTQNWKVYLLPWAMALVGFMRERPREEAV